MQEGTTENIAAYWLNMGQVRPVISSPEKQVVELYSGQTCYTLTGQAADCTDKSVLLIMVSGPSACTLGSSTGKI